MDHHEKYMKRCLQLGALALKNGNAPVGAILTLGNIIIGEGTESVKNSGDVTNHAEIMAIRNAIKNGYQNDLSKAKLYTTHEPCIMCSYMIRHHRIPEIIFGIPVADVGGYTSSFKILITQKIPKWSSKPKIIQGICKSECELLNKKFLSQKKELKKQEE